MATIKLKRDHLVRSHSFSFGLAESDSLFRIWDSFTDDHPHLTVPRDEVKIVWTGAPETRGISTMQNVWAVVTSYETVELPDPSPEKPAFDPQDLKHGAYRIFWKSGGSSVASVGSDRIGQRWFSPTNWTIVPSKDWALVERVERIDDGQD